MHQARSSIEEFVYVCASTALVVFTVAFLSLPYALERNPGDPMPVAVAAVPHLS